MKKLSLLLSLCTIMVTSHAQLFTFAPKLGLNLPLYSPKSFEYSMNGDEYTIDGGGSTLQLGIFIIRDFSDLFLQIDPTYFTCKVKLKDPSGVATDAKMSGVNVPVIVGKKINMFRVFAGGSPYLVFEGDLNRPEDEIMNYMAVDYLLGVGVDISSFIMNARFSAPAWSDTKVKTSQIIFTVGFKLNKQ